MFELLKKLEPKFIASIITAVGGLILAAMIFQAYQRLAEVKTVEISDNVKELSNIILRLKDVMMSQVEATKSNTEATKELRAFIIQIRTQSKK